MRRSGVTALRGKAGDSRGVAGEERSFLNGMGQQLPAAVIRSRFDCSKPATHSVRHPTYYAVRTADLRSGPKTAVRFTR